MKGLMVVAAVALLVAGCAAGGNYSPSPEPTIGGDGMDAGVDMAVANLRKNGIKPMTADQCIEQHPADYTQTTNGVTYYPRQLCLKVAGKYYASDAKPKGNSRELFDLSDDQIGEAKKAVARELKDPYSAQFEGLYGSRIKDDHSKYAICGMVNAKNSYGGYTGAKPFMYSPGIGVTFPGKPGSLDSDLVKLGCDGE